MALAPPTLELRNDEKPLFSIQGDLTSLGSLGAAQLTVTDQTVYRLEKTPLGEEIVASYPLYELDDPRIEDLVDASALVARFHDRDVELIRATSARALQISSAEKK